MGGPTGGNTWIVDLIALAFIAWYAVSGWRMGLLRSVLLVAGLLLAIWCGARFAPALAEKFGTALPSGARFGLAFALLFAATIIGVGLLGRLVERAMAVSPLGILDRVGGAAFGALKAALLIAVLGVLLAMVPISSRWITGYLESRVVRASMDAGGAVVRAVEPYASGSVADFIYEAEEYIRQHTEKARERAADDKDGH